MSRFRAMARRAAVTGVNGTTKVLGRRRAVRTARFASNVLRYDDWNRIDSNGELLVQQVARSRPDPVVFDVGANVGQWSTSLLAQPGYPPDLYAFEPSSYSFARAAKALGARASVHPLAMSSEPGRAELQIVKQGAGVNSLVPFGGERAVSATETVDVATIDRFCEEHGIRAITLLKVDTEGLDLSVLRGALELLVRGDIGIVQFEYNWRWVSSRAYLKDMFDLIADLPRYSLGKVAPKGIEFYDRWHPELETFRESNYALVRDDWRPAFPSVKWWGG